MELDFSLPWRIVPASADVPAGTPFPDPALAGEPLSFAAAELAAVLGRMTGAAPAAGNGSEGERLIVLRAGSAKPGSPACRAAPFSWRAEPGRVEIFGEGGRGLVRGVYDFLDAAGARWIEPGDRGERLPSGTRLALALPSRRSPELETAATLIVGHGALLVGWADYLAWAARAGYSSLFVHTTPDAFAFAAVPERLYERLRADIAPLARRLGIALELGGHHLSAFLPRRLFKEEPELFRESGGKRSPDSNFCPSSRRSLELAAAGFVAFAKARPEIEVFHVWPDDLPGGGWCSCPACSSLSPAAQSLTAARELARALSDAGLPARLSFLAYHDTEELAGLDLGDLPPNLELLWAPRRRCWAHGLDEASCALDAASSTAYRAAASAWRAAGGGGTTIFEYWEDAILFKGAVPPLPGTMAGDLALYAGPDAGAAERADAVGVLLTGGRRPLAPRPNQWLLPRLLRRAAWAGEPRERAAEELADWVRATYGPAAGPMSRYWAELEAAWAIDLELEPGDTETQPPATRGINVDEPPTDWGDPWTASPARLAERRGRCEELFDRLREAEKALAEALEAAARPGAAGPDAAGAAPAWAHTAWAAAVRAEAREYAIAGNLLELDCARLASYHERAEDQAKAAADIALLAHSPYAALMRAFRAIPDSRARREMGLFLYSSYGLRLRAIRREAVGPLKKAIGRAAAIAELGLRAAPLYRAWERP